MYQGALGNIDPKTGEIKYYPLAPEWNDDRVQLNFVGLRHDVDGKVWTKSVGTQDVFRLDLASGKWERFHPTDHLPHGQAASIYQVISDSQNNLWMAEFEEGYLGKIDAKTLKVTWYSVAFAARARAPHGDRRSGPHPGDRISRPTRSRCSTPRRRNSPNTICRRARIPYRAQFDKNGEIWTAA